MPDAIKRRDAETTVRNYLLPYMTVPVSTQIPDPRPANFLRILRTGGVIENQFIDRAQITLEGWGDTEDDAADTLATALAWLERAEGLVFGLVELAGPANLPDPTSAQIRYTATVLARIRTLQISA